MTAATPEQREYRRRWREANREKIAAQKRAYYAANRDRFLAERKVNHEGKRDKHNAYSRAYMLRKKPHLKRYGINIDEYNALVLARGLNCPVCGDETKPVVDHCHETGVVRGIICHGCNLALGGAKDRPETLRRLADYLEASRCP